MNMRQEQHILTREPAHRRQDMAAPAVWRHRHMAAAIQPGGAAQRRIRAGAGSYQRMFTKT